ncbi:MAG TPA: DAK2 domain-containing protein [Solirubrobacteraceae bacterium]|nr:DAK2 domain-containing protein [Solirubrobacteraceae bacterium]
MSDPSLVRFRAVVEGALAHLESRRQEINDLNVFPVADGDTGDNMALTLRAVLGELDRIAADSRSPGGSPATGEQRLIDEIGRDEIVESVARAALLGARGNSGVILSQLIRGAAEELVSRPGELVDPVLIGAAMARAAQRAYGSVRAPAEGTILTVMREMATRVATELAHMGDTRLGAEGDPAVQNSLIADVLERALEAGEEAVRRGPEMLDALRESGVVDAGGHALTVMVAGMIAALRGTEPPSIARHAPPARVSHPEHSSSTYRYCTNFAVTGRDLDPSAWTAPLEAIGDSVLVVGDAATLKVHVHTDDPAAAKGLFDGVGEVSRVDVADMHVQVQARSERLAPASGAAPPRCRALAVVAGAGMRELFESLGVAVLDGGPTLNPSTYELLAGIHEVPAEEIVVLPNSPNVVMAAEHAAELSEKVVRVAGARSQQAGLAAALALNPSRSAADNVAAIDDALARLRTGAVAPAARDDGDGRFAVGDAVGFVDETIVAWGEPGPTLGAVLDALASDAELLTCIAGHGAPLDEDSVRALVPGGVEVECEVGGQPSYWWLVSAE